MDTTITPTRAAAHRAMTGNRLKSIRTRVGLTQRELADELDVSLRLITHFERGTKIIPRSIARAMYFIERFGLDLPDDTSVKTWKPWNV